MNVIIEYSDDTDEYKLYVKELEILLTSHELFRVLVMLNEVVSKLKGKDFNILDSNDIYYTLDSRSMSQMVSSNVSLLKKVNRMPSEFQSSIERFGSSTLSTNQFSGKRKEKDKLINKFDKIANGKFRK